MTSPRLTRRRFLALGGDLALLALVPGEVLAALVDPARRREGDGLYLDAGRMRTLRALCAHFVPGPPEDPDPGAVEAGVAEYIDLLLGAFETKRPPILAGGPFSFREGGGKNGFAEFLELDALEKRIWRTRIEGSRGLPEREWNGPVVGWQQRYREGLAALDGWARRWGGAPFHDLAPWQVRWLLRLAQGELEEFLDLAFRHTLEGMYGAPEYGGNRGLVGWRYTRWPGDHQPHSYTWKEIAEPDAEEDEAVQESVRNAETYLGRKLPRG